MMIAYLNDKRREDSFQTTNPLADKTAKKRCFNSLSNITIEYVYLFGVMRGILEVREETVPT